MNITPISICLCFWCVMQQSAAQSISLWLRFCFLGAVNLPHLQPVRTAAIRKLLQSADNDCRSQKLLQHFEVSLRVSVVAVDLKCLLEVMFSFFVSAHCSIGGTSIAVDSGMITLAFQSSVECCHSIGVLCQFEIRRSQVVVCGSVFRIKLYNCCCRL